MIRRNSLHTSRPYRRLAPQVLRSRLRPCWRIAIKVPVVLALLGWIAWAGRAVAIALEEQAIADMQAEMATERDQRMLQIEQDRARSAASSNAYVPGEEQLCELLYGREVAVCDRATLRRLAEDTARERLKPSPARPIRGATSPAPPYGAAPDRTTARRRPAGA